jgi:hypothetical protein
MMHGKDHLISQGSPLFASRQDLVRMLDAFTTAQQDFHLDDNMLEEDLLTDSKQKSKEAQVASWPPKSTRRGPALRSTEEYMKILSGQLSEAGTEEHNAWIEHTAELMVCSRVLRTLSAPQRTTLARTACMGTVEAGQTIKISAACYIVLAGQIDLTMIDRSHVDIGSVLSSVSPAECFGDLTLLGEPVRTVASVAKGKPSALFLAVSHRAYSVITEALKVGLRCVHRAVFSVLKSFQKCIIIL